MIGIFALLAVAMILVVKFCKKTLKIVLSIIASMCLCSDIIYIPAYATELDPTLPITDVDPGTGENPDGGNTEDPTNPDTGGDSDTDDGDNDTGEGGNTENPDGSGNESQDPDTDPEEPEYIPSDINTLSSLEVEGFELSPSFDAHTLEYNLTINAGYEKINIKAGKTDYKSSLSGLGEYEVSWKQGKYDFKITFFYSGYFGNLELWKED